MGQQKPADPRRAPVSGSRRPWLFIALAFVLGGCSGLPAASPSNVPSVPTVEPTQVATTTNAPTGPVSDGFDVLPAQPPADFEGGVTCSGTIGASDPVAIVEMQGAGEGSGDTLLIDYDDPDAPRTVCVLKGDGWTGMRLLDGRHAVMGSLVEVEGLYAVIDLSEVRYHWLQLPPRPETSYSSELISIPPSLDRVAWVARDPDISASDTIHLTTAAADKALTVHLPNNNTGRCGDADDSNLGAYTTSGSLVYVLNRPLASNASLVVVEGEEMRYSLVAPKEGWPSGKGPAMAVWSPTLDTLYYRNGEDVWRWTADAGATKFILGIRWSFPTITPDGTYLAYAVLDADGLSDVYLVDLANGADPVRLGTGRRGLPAFLNNDQLWYVAMDYGPGCAGGGTATPFVYDLRFETETRSTIQSVIATWPATSSNH